MRGQDLFEPLEPAREPELSGQDVGLSREPSRESKHPRPSNYPPLDSEGHQTRTMIPIVGVGGSGIGVVVLGS